METYKGLRIYKPSSSTDSAVANTPISSEMCNEQVDHDVTVVNADSAVASELTKLSFS